MAASTAAGGIRTGTPDSSRDEGGDRRSVGVLLAFVAYLSVCFLFVSYILFSFCINFLLALFSFSDFVYFAGRACARL